MKVRFVLIRPRNPLNIGAAARAVANFGFTDLVVVGPYLPSWREAKSAVEAAPVLRKAKNVGSVARAVKGCHVIVGTSAGTRRAMDQRWVSPAELMVGLGRKGSGRKQVAVLFGSEKSGLRNQDLDFCHFILRLPTIKKYPSMNLGQAVALVSYLFSARHDSSDVGVGVQAPVHALTTDILERLIQQGAKALDASGVYKGWNSRQREVRIRQSINRWDLKASDVAMLHGLFRWILRKK